MLSVELSAGKKPPGALPSLMVSLLTSTAYGPVLAAALPAVAGAARPVLALFTFAEETKMRTPFGTLLKTAFKRVPKSARPAVPPLTVGPNTKFRSEEHTSELQSPSF